ncbi:MAG: hypothetical protein ACD_56C00097G0005 [uncultured bacterium]|nr:MAG: hypothetical protein ACD_56C00097G0005 [uncultured bacterium]
MEKLEKINLQIRRCVAISSLLFLVFIFWGYRLAIKNPQDVSLVLEQTLAQFASIKNLSAFMIFLLIFLNNAIKAFFVTILGTLFGIVPLIFIFLNGELIGFVFGISQVEGLGVMRVLIGIAPHGVLEIPAIMLSAGYGLWLGYRFLLFVLHRDEFRKYFFLALGKYFTLILPLLFLAALIEAFITPYFLGAR